MDRLRDEEKEVWLESNRYYANRARDCNNISTLVALIQELEMVTELPGLIDVAEGAYKGSLKETLTMGDGMMWIEIVMWKLKQLRIKNEQGNLSQT